MTKEKIAHEIEKLETERINVKSTFEKECIDYEIGLLKMQLNPEQYHPVI